MYPKITFIQRLLLSREIEIEWETSLGNQRCFPSSTCKHDDSSTHDHHPRWAIFTNDVCTKTRETIKVWEENESALKSYSKYGILSLCFSFFLYSKVLFIYLCFYLILPQTIMIMISYFDGPSFIYVVTIGFLSLSRNNETCEWEREREEDTLWNVIPSFPFNN